MLKTISKISMISEISIGAGRQLGVQMKETNKEELKSRNLYRGLIVLVQFVNEGRLINKFLHFET